MSQTGEHPAVTDEKAPGIGELFAVALRRALGREALILGAFAITIGGVVLYGQHAFAQTVRDSVDAGTEALREDATRTKERIEQHIREEAEFRLQVLRRLDEGSADSRALYKAVMTGRKQDRLEGDGGQ